MTLAYVLHMNSLSIRDGEERLIPKKRGFCQEKQKVA